MAQVEESPVRTVPAGYGDPWEVAELPAPPPFSRSNLMKMVGVSAIMVSVSIGSGEWLLGPGVSVRYGVAMLWVVTVATILQTIFNLENIRYTLATGEPSIVGATRLWPGPKLWGPVWVILCVLSVGPGWVLTASTALTAIILNRMPGDPDKATVLIAGWILMALVMLLLSVGGKIEATLERISKALIVVIFAGLLLLNIAFVPFETWVSTALGFFQFGFLPESSQGIDWGLVGGFAAYAAAGGVINMAVANYTRDKGWGMGSVVGYIPALVGGKLVHVSPNGKIFEPTEENVSRFNGWFRYAKWEQWVLFAGGCLVGMYLSVLLAVSMIPKGTNIAGWAVAAHQAKGVADVLGTFGWVLVLGIGFWVLWGTQLNATEAAVRHITDILWLTSPWARKMSQADIRKIYYAILVLMTIWMGYQLTKGTPLALIVFIANIAGLVFVIAGLKVLIANHLLLPKAIRPGIVPTLGMLTLSVFYGFFVYRALGPAILGWLK